ncbi:hypothetical protein chiPu_0003306 [Chiloscyllium punctatum]|uniref:Iron-sulfur cluster assembly 1 homolog, mitochondrial n=1 Tax=Chiloscyllium punctatum TaxID=137246 RepID=A0A401S3A7_CHIPU|nr:hypothetical protein [Chiloscyllium punctatum]
MVSPYTTIRMTPLAVNKIKQLLQEKPEYIGLKIGVRTRGCNGLSYTLEYTKEKRESDEEVVQDVWFPSPAILILTFPPYSCLD